MTGDTYIAMNYGPVPSALYDMIKGNCSPELRVFTQYDKGFFDISKKCNMDYLSESDVETLQKAFDENAKLSFDGLVQKSANHIAKELGRLCSGFYSSEDFLNFVQSKLNSEFVQLETAQLENIQKGRCRICDESFYEPDFDCRINETKE